MTRNWLAGRMWARLALILLPIALCVTEPAVRGIYQRLSASTEVALEFLLQGFSVDAFEVHDSGAHLVVGAELHNASYIVINGRAVPPGAEVASSTPARQALLLTVLPVIGIGFFLPRARRRAVLAVLGASFAAVFAYVLAVPVVLAGTICDAIQCQDGGISLEWLAIWGSKFMLHGGGYAIAAATVLAAKEPGQQPEYDPRN